MLSVSRPCPDSVGLPLSRKRDMSDRRTVRGSQAPVQPHLPANSGETLAASPLAKRFASLTVAQSPLPQPTEASMEVCPALCPVPESGGDQALKEALTTLACDALCSPEQVELLKKTYGGLKQLLPYLGNTLVSVEGLSLSFEEWKSVVTEYPLAIAKVPEEFRVRDDFFYVEALCVSEGSAEVVKQLPTGHKERLCRKALFKNPALVELLPACERTPEHYKAACIEKPALLRHVPPDIQTETFLLALCCENPLCFRYIDDRKKTERQAKLVCRECPILLDHVPPRLRSDDLYTIACLADSSFFQSLPEALRTEQFCLRLVKKSFLALCDIPPGKITAEMCEQACCAYPAMMRWVPDHLKTESLCQKVLAKTLSFLAYPYLPRGLVSRSQCEEMCKQSGRLDCVPSYFKNEEMYRLAAASGHDNFRLKDVLEKDRTRARCLQSAIDRECDFTCVPNDHIDLHFLLSVIGGKDDLALHRRAQKLLPEEDYTTFLCVSALYRTKTQLKLLTWSALPDHFRERLIDFLAGTGEPIALHRLPKHSLINRHNPLRFEMYNPLVSKLLLQAHTARNYQPACQTDGEAWLHYLEQHQPKYINSPLPLIDDTLSAPLKTGHIKAKGGRTLQVQHGDNIYYYKFQRQGESLKDLVREGLIHQFRAENPQGAWAKLASDLPTDPHFFVLPKSMWPQQKADFKDEIEVQKEGKREWANVYRYTASADYGRYAHQLDSAADCPFTKPEDAILTACYDMGLFASMGLMLTSMLPAMHNSDSGKSWQALYDLFGYHSSTEVHPGTLGAWNSTATEHCDIGFNGLRDVGDYEQFGAIQSCFEKSGNDGSAQPVATGQRLAVASTLCDNMMAAILVRSRLRRDDGNYHYKKEQAVDDTADFIGTVCDHLLTGLAGKGKDEVQAGITRYTMALNGQDYDDWIVRAAEEIIYWTARQADPNGPPAAVSDPSTNGPEPMDCFAAHLTQQSNLSDTLYDPAQFQPSMDRNSWPKKFRNGEHKDNLGGHSEVFPFTSLVQGLTSLVGDLLAHPQRLLWTQVDDPAMASE